MINNLNIAYNKIRGAGHLASSDRAHVLDEARSMLESLRDRHGALVNRLAGGSEPNGGSDLAPFAWPLEFPDVFLTEDPGFDAVVVNPPFVQSSGGSEYRRAVERFCSPLAGAWDVYAAFINRADQLLSKRGRACIVAPITSIAADYMSAVHDGLLRRSRLASVTDYSSLEIFGKASVYVVVIGISSTLNEQVDFFAGGWHERTLTSSVDLSATRDWPPGYLCLPFGPAADYLQNLSFSRTVGDLASFSDGATTSEAYEIKDLVHDLDPDHREVYRLINTGTVDPFESLWGKRKTKYLGLSLLHPVVSSVELERHFPRRAAQAASPKVVLGGLNARLECFADEGAYLAGKSTVLGIVNEDVCPYALAALLNSDAYTKIYSSLFGYRRFSKVSMNIGPRQIESLPLPLDRLTCCREPGDERETASIVKSGNNGRIDMLLCYAGHAIHEDPGDLELVSILNDSVHSWLSAQTRDG